MAFKANSWFVCCHDSQYCPFLSSSVLLPSFSIWGFWIAWLIHPVEFPSWWAFLSEQKCKTSEVVNTPLNSLVLVMLSHHPSSSCPPVSRSPKPGSQCVLQESQPVFGWAMALCGSSHTFCVLSAWLGVSLGQVASWFRDGGAGAAPCWSRFLPSLQLFPLFLWCSSWQFPLW